MKVNVAKTKVMISGAMKAEEVRSKCPCGVCGKGVGNNSVTCIKCKKWVHKHCSRVKGSLVNVSGTFVCRKCNEPALNINAVGGHWQWCNSGDGEAVLLFRGHD